MNKEALEDYSKKEEEEYTRFRKKVLEGHFTTEDIYPSKDRFVKLHEPLARAAPLQSIWPQVPLSGSPIVALAPRTKERFKLIHGFDANDIDRIVNFAKDTGKIQFVLLSSPTHYAELDYLDPIFIELKPPQGRYFPLEILLNEHDIQKYYDAFLRLASGKFLETLISGMFLAIDDPLIIDRREYIHKRVQDYGFDYIMFKALGLQTLVEELEKLMNDDPLQAIRMFNVLGCLVAVPKLNPLRAVQNYSIDSFAESVAISKEYGIQTEDVRFPCEIGKFLMRKLTLYPESLDACKNIISYYEENDIHCVMEALNDGVKRNIPDLVNMKTIELSTILDNIWKDADKISRRITTLKFGIPVSTAVIGAIAAGPIGGVGGLLAGLGFSVAGKILDTKAESISEKLGKLTLPNHLVTIYDFKKQYSVRR